MAHQTLFSSFGHKLATRSGIMELMDDLGNANASGDMLMLGGGNPAAIPEMQQTWRQELSRLEGDGDELDKVLCNYDPPRGNPQFLASLAKLLRQEYGWDITENNIAVTNSSQNAFFMLFNMLGGKCDDGSYRKILLPLMPEYIGYADQGIEPDLFKGNKPLIQYQGEHGFKYGVDFDTLELGDDIAAVCVSRPTNPTGNVLTDDEVTRLAALTKEAGIPFIIDNAYGAPFPGILFRDIKPYWDDHVILSLSLSKLGLPGTRTGIVIGSETIIRAISAANAIVTLANGNVGQAIITPCVQDGRILEWSKSCIRPFYEERMTNAMTWANEFFDDSLPWRIHTCEGALFLWLWCPGLPITSKELYERLKNRGVLVVSGSYFFYGLDEDWQHQHECIRINYSQPPETVREGLRIIADEVKRAYSEDGGSSNA